MAAALVASLEGLEVLLCEASPQVGGTSATSAGTLWIPGNRQSLAAGFNDSAEAAEAYLDSIIGAETGRHLRAAFLRTGPDAIDYLAARSDVIFRPCGRHPDYRSNQKGAAVAGRAIIPEPFDGRLLGADFERVRPPIPEFMVLGGMMVGKDDIPRLVGRFRSLANLRHAAKLVARYLGDRLRYSRGTRLVMGNALVARLYYSLRKRGVPILFETAIEEMLGGREGVTGAVLRSKGDTIAVRARRGVVLATGGYARNSELRTAFMPPAGRARSMAAPTDVGDGILLGRTVGARVAPEEHLSGAFWSQVSVTRRGDGTTGLFPHLVLDRAKPGLIAVNSAGRRFVNEANSYHDFVEAMLASHQTVPSIPAYLICEADFVRRYGLGAVHPGTRSLAPFERRPWRRSRGGSRSMRPDSATRSGASTNSPARAPIPISARARPSSTASTAIPITDPTPASARLRAHPSAPLRAGPPRSRPAPASRPTRMPACWATTDGRSPDFTPAGTTWPRSCKASTPGPASRWDPRLCLPIAPRATPPPRAARRRASPSDSKGRICYARPTSPCARRTP